ncbi:MAG: class A beta-lactamase [Gammaproteobacteria bacterium]|nr:class A beta-lactamase [Gammaproteobacteria bacterium]
MKSQTKLFLLMVLFLFSNAFAGEDKLNAIMNTVSQKLHQLEIKNHVEIGLSAIEAYNNTQINYHANKRFPMDSTSKLMTVSAILKKSESDPTLLRRKIFFTAEDVKKSGYAPITTKHIKSGMTVYDLCAVSLEYSDSAAVNQLIKILGGPNKVTQFARSIGDEKYLLVRWEPELNSAIPHDKRDTTTPSAMADSVQKLVLGNALGNSQRQQLKDWLKHCKTGNNRIRAGVPRNFIVADKTGTGGYGSIGDIGVVWRPHASAIVLALYVRQNEKNAHTSGKVIEQATKIVMNAVSIKMGSD